MKKILAALMGASLLAFTLAGCTGYNGSNQPNRAVASCSDVLDSVVRLIRSDETSGQFNNDSEWLRTHCAAEFDVFTDYASARASIGVTGTETCETWTQRIGNDAIALLREDGLCTDGEVNTQPTETWPDGGLGWDAARDHAGTRQRVCGPLMSLRNTEDGAFLNLGVDYPSSDRFTFVLWGVALEPIEDGATICGSGDVYLFEGVVPEIELSSSEEIEIWR